MKGLECDIRLLNGSSSTIFCVCVMFAFMQFVAANNNFDITAILAPTVGRAEIEVAGVRLMYTPRPTDIMFPPGMKSANILNTAKRPLRSDFSH